MLIEAHISRSPSALEIPTEAEKRISQCTVLALGAGKEDRIGGQTLKLLHQLDNGPKSIIHYQRSRDEAEDLQRKLGPKAIETAQANLGNFEQIHAMFENMGTVPNILINTAAPYHLDSRRNPEKPFVAEKAEENFSGIFLNNLWTTLIFAMKNRGREALAVLFSDWIVETKEAHEGGYGLYEGLSYFVAKGGLSMLPQQLRIGVVEARNEKALFDPSVRVRLVRDQSELTSTERSGNTFVWEKRRGQIPELGELTPDNISHYASQIEAYVRDNLWEPMVKAMQAVNAGQSVVLVFPEENWLDRIILRGVSGLKEVLESDSLRIDVVAPGPTIPWAGISQEELEAVAFHSLTGWSGAGPIAETVKDCIVQFCLGNMQGGKFVRASGREVVARIREETED